MQSIETLDVRILEPKKKHPSIFEKFTALENDHSFIILNDHDPKPLYYQMLGELGDVFYWEYLEKGPEAWQVQITKTKKLEETTIGDMVTKDFRKAEIFKKFKIDFCCGGNKTLKQVCTDKNIDMLDVEYALHEIQNHTSIPALPFNNWKIDFLVDYIINTHHEYTAKAIPVLLEYTHKVAKVHRAQHPEMTIVENTFLEVAQELTKHMLKEEKILFPYIKKLSQASEYPELLCGSNSIKNPIEAMENDHAIIGELFKSIRQLCNDYIPPADACATFQVTLKKLEEFENDLLQHIHLENNILFPKSKALENQIIA